MGITATQLAKSTGLTNEQLVQALMILVQHRIAIPQTSADDKTATRYTIDMKAIGCRVRLHKCIKLIGVKVRRVVILVIRSSLSLPCVIFLHPPFLSFLTSQIVLSYIHFPLMHLTTITSSHWLVRALCGVPS